MWSMKTKKEKLCAVLVVFFFLFLILKKLYQMCELHFFSYHLAFFFVWNVFFYKTGLLQYPLPSSAAALLLPLLFTASKLMGDGHSLHQSHVCLAQS